MICHKQGNVIGLSWLDNLQVGEGADFLTEIVAVVFVQLFRITENVNRNRQVVVQLIKNKKYLLKYSMSDNQKDVLSNHCMTWQLYSTIVWNCQLFSLNKNVESFISVMYLKRRSDSDHFPSVLSDNIVHYAILYVILGGTKIISCSLISDATRQ